MYYMVKRLRDGVWQFYRGPSLSRDDAWTLDRTKARLWERICFADLVSLKFEGAVVVPVDVNAKEV